LTHLAGSGYLIPYCCVSPDAPVFIGPNHLYLYHLSLRTRPATIFSNTSTTRSHPGVARRIQNPILTLGTLIKTTQPFPTQAAQTGGAGRDAQAIDLDETPSN
jgi:hypothetical protein